MWQCPLCQSPLTTGQVWHCPNNHRFDVSRRGYVNLLPVQKKGSKQPGDSKAMLTARQLFHHQQGYQPLMAKMAEMLCAQVVDTADKPFTLYDAGCGEGTYLHALQNALSGEGITVNAAGSDIAKSAVDFAARQYKNAQFVVASSFDLPVQEQVADALLQVFAPGDDRELRRILKPGGVLLHVAPGPFHLYSLKQVAYEMPRLHEMPAEQREGYRLMSREQLSFDVALSTTSQSEALLMMTPFTWRLNDTKRQSLVDSLKSVQADFIITLWQKI